MLLLKIRPLYLESGDRRDGGGTFCPYCLTEDLFHVKPQLSNQGVLHQGSDKF